MEFELPKINVSFEYDEEKDEIVFVINGVEKRVKTEDMITEMEKLQEQNTALEQEPCEDCISRKAVLDCFKKWQPYMATRIFEYEQELKALPSIQPKPKIGHWIKMPIGFKCSKCNGLEDKTSKCCPNCGAKMIEAQERSGKE